MRKQSLHNFSITLLIFLFCLAIFQENMRAQSPSNASSQPTLNESIPANTRVAPVAPPPNQAALGSVAAQDSAGEIRLDAGDLISLKVFGAPELSEEQRISSSGEINVPLAGTIPVKNLLPQDAQRLIEDKLKNGGILRDPHVTIFVKEFATQGISVMGEVAKPGIYPLIGKHRLYDVISAAGGTTPKAGKQISISHRSEPQHPVYVSLRGDLGNSQASNVPVFPGDTVDVSRAGIVYVVGEVRMPGGFTMDNNEQLSVMQALALAQGNLPTASLKAARIVRRGPGGVQEIPVALNKIEQAKAPDVALQSNDVLFIPGSIGKSAMRRSAEAVLQLATGAIYHY